MSKKCDDKIQTLQEIKVELTNTPGDDEESETIGFLSKNEDKDKVASSYEEEIARTKKYNAAFAVGFYWITSLSLVFLNKIIMDGDVINLDAPLFMSWTQFVITVICCWILGILGKKIQIFALFPPFEYKLEVAKRVLPLTFVFLGMIIFNNLCLKYVEVSFYQVARSLTIVFNVGFSYSLLGQKTTQNALICCGVIVMGYILGCDGEVRFSVLGVVFGVLSSIFVALNAIYVKKILPVVENNSEKLMIYNNLNAIIILPFIVFFTDEKIELVNNSVAFSTSIFWTITMVAGVFGCLLNLATYMQIKFTSPLSHNVSGTAKAAAQTIIALIIFQNPVTYQGMVGNFIVIVASFAYSQVK